MWQVTLRSCVMEFSINGLQYLYLLLCCSLDACSRSGHAHGVKVTLIQVPVHLTVRAIRTSESRTSGAFMVTRTSTNICNSVAIKTSVKIVKYLEFLQKLTLPSPVMLYAVVYVKTVSHLYYMLYSINKYHYMLTKTRPRQKQLVLIQCLH